MFQTALRRPRYEKKSIYFSFDPVNPAEDHLQLIFYPGWKAFRLQKSIFEFLVIFLDNQFYVTIFIDFVVISKGFEPQNLCFPLVGKNNIFGIISLLLRSGHRAWIVIAIMCYVGWNISRATGYMFNIKYQMIDIH